MDANTFDGSTPGTLYESTLALLHGDRRTLLEIHHDSGLPYYWLKKFRNREIPDPSVNKVQALYEFLSETKLHVQCPCTTSR